jgi:hypothetical protein
MSSYFEKTPKKWIKISMAIKGLCGTLAASAFVMEDKILTIIILVVGALATEAINFLKDDEPAV